MSLAVIMEGSGSKCMVLKGQRVKINTVLGLQWFFMLDPNLALKITDTH